MSWTVKHYEGFSNDLIIHLSFHLSVSLFLVKRFTGGYLLPSSFLLSRCVRSHTAPIPERSPDPSSHPSPPPFPTFPVLYSGPVPRPGPLVVSTLSRESSDPLAPSRSFCHPYPHLRPDRLAFPTRSGGPVVSSTTLLLERCPFQKSLTPSGGVLGRDSKLLKYLLISS